MISSTRHCDDGKSLDENGQRKGIHCKACSVDKDTTGQFDDALMTFMVCRTCESSGEGESLRRVARGFVVLCQNASFPRE